MEDSVFTPETFERLLATRSEDDVRRIRDWVKAHDAPGKHTAHAWDESVWPQRLLTFEKVEHTDGPLRWRLVDG